jgi:hypothetical protein
MASLDHNKGSIIVQAGMGLGKTQAVGEYLKTQAEKYGVENLIVVWPTFRKTLTIQNTHSMTSISGLPFESYLDMEPGPISLVDHPFLCIQYDSLGRLMGGAPVPSSTKIILVCDEIVSLVSQMESPAGSPALAMAVFQGLVEEACHILYLDANINNPVIDVIKSFHTKAGRELPEFVINTYSRYKDNGTTMQEYTADDDTALEAALYSKLDLRKNEERVGVMTSSRNKANKLYHAILIKFPKLKVVVYTGDTPDDVRKKDFQDVDKAWQPYDVIIFNSVCEAGISCLLPVDNVFLFARADLTTVRALYQLTGRFRRVKQIRYHIRTRACTMDCIDRLPIDAEAILRQYTSGRRPIPTSCMAGVSYTPSVGATFDADTPFAKILVANARHRNASAMAFSSLYRERCESAGITMLDPDGTTMDQNKEFEVLVKKAQEKTRDAR